MQRSWPVDLTGGARWSTIPQDPDAIVAGFYNRDTVGKSNGGLRLQCQNTPAAISCETMVRRRAMRQIGADGALSLSLAWGCSIMHNALHLSDGRTVGVP